MNLIAEFIIIGRVGKITDLGKAIKVSIASSYPYKDDHGSWQDRTHWNTITIFNESTRKWVTNNLETGDVLHTTGRMGDDSYVKNGETVYTTSLVATQVNRIVAKADLKPKNNDVVD